MGGCICYREYNWNGSNYLDEWSCNALGSATGYGSNVADACADANTQCVSACNSECQAHSADTGYGHVAGESYYVEVSNYCYLTSYCAP